MATAFTINSVTSEGPWLVADGYSTDVSGTAQAIIVAVANTNHLVRSIAIDYGKTDKWIKILDGSDLQIGPFECGSKHWEQDFGEDGALTFEEGVYIETEADSVTHVTVVYKIQPRL